MIRIYKSIFFLLAFSTQLLSQNTANVIWEHIEKNNSTLNILRAKMKADKIEHHTDLFLQNPELGFNYLWGDPSAMGTRKDFSIMQSFDFPTAYNYRNKIAHLKDNQLALEYEKQKRNIQLQTNVLCVNMQYTNTLLKVLRTRISHAQKIADAYRLKLKYGECNILDYNKAQLSLIDISKAHKKLQIDSTALSADMMRLNGGISLKITPSFITPPLNTNFEQWYNDAEKKSPILLWLANQVEIRETEIKLHKANVLPKFQAGYMSESVVGESYRGLSFGMSIPLWENKNKVKLAKANRDASMLREENTRTQFYLQLKALHQKVVALQKTTIDYRTQIHDFNTSKLLAKALENGDISLITYLMELSSLYKSIDQVLEMEKELNEHMAHLRQFEL